MAVDEAFFREWDQRGPEEGRSVRRARELADSLGVLSPGVPVLTVVGSKGKGTTATYASAVLTAAGLRVCTVTSPGYRSNRERIRIDGAAVSEAELASLSKRLGDAIEALPRSSGGYLSPSGLFLLAGVRHARHAGADVLVLEAGMGGRLDEVALFPPDLVAITSVFGEHLGVLGGSVTEIAEEKAAVVSPDTRAVLSAPQTGPVARILTTTVRDIAGVEIDYPPDAEAAPPSEAAPPLEGASLTAPGHPPGRAGAELGTRAAHRLLDLAGRPAPAPGRLRAVLASVRLPGRLSWHAVPGTATELLADSAIDPVGVSMALSAALSRWGAVDHVLVCLPDHKDLNGAITALRGLPVTFVRLPHDHLRFTRPLPAGWRVLESGDLTAEFVGGLGRRVAALGTVYFIGLVLDLVGAGTERLYG